MDGWLFYDFRGSDPLGYRVCSSTLPCMSRGAGIIGFLPKARLKIAASN